MTLSTTLTFLRDVNKSGAIKGFLSHWFDTSGLGQWHILFIVIGPQQIKALKGE